MKLKYLLFRLLFILFRINDIKINKINKNNFLLTKIVFFINKNSIFSKNTFYKNLQKILNFKNKTLKKQSI